MRSKYALRVHQHCVPVTLEKDVGRTSSEWLECDLDNVKQGLGDNAVLSFFTEWNTVGKDCDLVIAVISTNTERNEKCGRIAAAAAACIIGSFVNMNDTRKSCFFIG